MYYVVVIAVVVVFFRGGAGHHFFVFWPFGDCAGNWVKCPAPPPPPPPETTHKLHPAWHVPSRLYWQARLDENSVYLFVSPYNKKYWKSISTYLFFFLFQKKQVVGHNILGKVCNPTYHSYVTQNVWLLSIYQMKLIVIFILQWHWGWSGSLRCHVFSGERETLPSSPSYLLRGWHRGGPGRGQRRVWQIFS